MKHFFRYNIEILIYLIVKPTFLSVVHWLAYVDIDAGLYILALLGSRKKRLLGWL